MYRRLLFIGVLLSMIPALVQAQAKIRSIKKINEGLYLMYFDSTQEKNTITKSTIVEFSDFLVLLEVPLSNKGGGATNLTDHSEGAEKILATLKENFPKKPLKYVISSHWHPHSISSVIPFISKGITVVTTKNNFIKLSEFVDSVSYKNYGKYITFVDQDSFVIKDKNNSVVVYKLEKKEYKSLPTMDYLFAYLPKYNYLHSACMYQRLTGSRVKGKEMISSRVEDLNSFMVKRKLSPVNYVCADLYWDQADGLISGDTFHYVMNKGIGMSVLTQEMVRIPNETLVSKSDSLIKALMDNRIPNSILNLSVYNALEKKDLQKALALARFQAMYNPSDPNAWDTLGEVYYFLEEEKLAGRYEKQSIRIDKDFKGGGMKTWKEDLEGFRKRWGE